MIDTTIRRLDAWLAAHRPSYYASLQAGQSEAALDETEKALGVRLPAGLRALLGWRDGQRDERAAFQTNRAWLSSRAAVEHAQMLDGLLSAGDFSDHVDWWRKGWIPFLSNGAGDLLCVDTTGAFGGRSGQVVEFWHDDPDRNIVAPDLDTWLDAIVASFEGGLWQERGAAFQPVDYEAVRAFLAEKIPGYPIAAGAKKNDKKAKARVSARDAIRRAFHALEGPVAGLATRIDPDRVVKAARCSVRAASDALASRREGARVEGVFEILPAPGEKKIAYAVWGTSTVGDTYRDGMVMGIDLKGNDIYKDKKVSSG